MSQIVVPQIQFPNWDYDKLLESYRISEEIIDQLSPEAVMELYNAVGAGVDYDNVLDTIVEETYRVLYGKSNRSSIQASNLGYLDKLSDSFEESLRCSNLNYFITSVLPEVELNTHHLDWGELVERYKYLCILASRGHGKSVDPDTEILMFNGSIKLAKNIKIGDQIMGPDSTPRNVTAVNSGIDNLYRVNQSNGLCYVVNSRHTLTLLKDSNIVDIDIEDYIKLPELDKTNHFGFKVSTISNEENLIEVDGYRIYSKSLLKIQEAGFGKYISITIDGDRRFVLGDNTVTHNSYYFSNAYPIWQLYRYKPKDNSSREQSKKKGVLFSFSVTQAVDLLTILRETIEDVDILRERLYNKNAWSKTEITCKNKTNLKVKGFGSSVRGMHPGWIIIDDGLKENVIYSQIQREKSTTYLHAVIMNMIVPGGPVTIVGTPLHAQDMYGDLKTKENWHVFEYPAIFPDGRILWPKMFSYFDLMEKRKSQGNLIFSRELLCRPITSDSTIFPIEILNTALLRMDEYTLVENRESFKVKFEHVVVGCDFAISSSTGADNLCYTVFGIDNMEKMWLIYKYHRKGVSYAEQIAKLKQINANFRPDVIVMENNVMQQIFVEGAIKEGLPVIGHTTGTSKNDLRTGLPGLAIIFERGGFKIPTGNQESKDFADTAVLQFSSIAFTEKGLQGVGEHDDVPLSFYLATIAARNISAGQFRFDFM